jgi:hypothetical protein
MFWNGSLPLQIAKGLLHGEKAVATETKIKSQPRANGIAARLKTREVTKEFVAFVAMLVSSIFGTRPLFR